MRNYYSKLKKEQKEKLNALLEAVDKTDWNDLEKESLFWMRSLMVILGKKKQ